MATLKPGCEPYRTLRCSKTLDVTQAWKNSKPRKEVPCPYNYVSTPRSTSLPGSVHISTPCYEAGSSSGRGAYGFGFWAAAHGSVGKHSGAHRAVDSRSKFSTCRFCGSLDLKSPFEDVVSIFAFMMLSR